MAFLKYVSSEGSGAVGMELRNVFKIGYGTTKLYRDRVVKALCSLVSLIVSASLMVPYFPYLGNHKLMTLPIITVGSTRTLFLS